MRRVTEQALSAQCGRPDDATPGSLPSRVLAEPTPFLLPAVKREGVFRSSRALFGLSVPPLSAAAPG